MRDYRDYIFVIVWIFLAINIIASCQTDKILEETEVWEEVEKPECPTTELQGFGGGATTADLSNLQHAEITCSKKYGKCLKMFRKVGYQNYHAVCGGKRVRS